MDFSSWDNFSDQPDIIRDKSVKKEIRRKYLFDHIKMILTALFMLPVSLLMMFFFKGKEEETRSDFYGIGVNLDKGNVQQELIEELGVKNLLIRVPLRDIENLNLYYDFAKSFTEKTPKHIVLNIMQDRKNIVDLSLLKENLEQIFTKFDGFVDEYQIGTAVNRSKWGFVSTKEYLNFFKVAYNLKNEKFKSIKLIGPSVIDFEYYVTARMLFNCYDLKFDITNALLYVDRRGNPEESQFFLFDTKGKIDLLFSLAKMSPKSKANIYISEVNWPLKGDKSYAPTSGTECVSHEEYAQYMLKYHEIAKKSKKVKRVYWHQLIAPGYGLVDNRDEKIVRLPQFYAYKDMIAKSS